MNSLSAELATPRIARIRVPVTSFFFPPDHRTASTRIKESRERSRIRKAVKKSRREGKIAGENSAEEKKRRKDPVSKKKIDRKNVTNVLKDHSGRKDQVGRTEHVSGNDKVGKMDVGRKIKKGKKNKEVKIKSKKHCPKAFKIKFNWNKK